MKNGYIKPNSYVALYRYPEGDLMPEELSVIEAISISEKIFVSIDL